MPDRIYYRGDKELYKRAKSQAALDGVTVAAWINEAIKLQLSFVPYNFKGKEKEVK